MHNTACWKEVEMSKHNLEAAKVLITGATKGIGRALAERFARAGASLALTARTGRDLEELTAALMARYPDLQVLSIAADLATPEGCEHIIATIKQHWSQLDVLINNAGVFLQDDLLSEPEANLDLSLQVNLYGPYRLCRGLQVPLSVAGNAHIFNICSVASQKAFPNCGSYVISKHALLGLSRALRLELLAKGIKVTAMMPGATYTASWEGSDMDPSRLMSPYDVAEAVFGVWMLGPSAVVEEMLLRPQLGDL